MNILEGIIVQIDYVVIVLLAIGSRTKEIGDLIPLFLYYLTASVVKWSRVPGYRSNGPCQIFWEVVHSALWVQLKRYFKEKVAALV
jgi:hypothetical protein